MRISKSLKSGYSARSITREWATRNVLLTNPQTLEDHARPALTDSKAKVKKTTTKPTPKSICNKTEFQTHVLFFATRGATTQPKGLWPPFWDQSKQRNWPPKKCPQYNWQFQVQVCFFAARGATTQPKRLLPPHWEDQCSVVAHIALPKETAGRCVLHPLCPCHPHPGPAAPHVPCTSNVKEYLYSAGN